MCALFGSHKGHEIRMEQEVLEEIEMRSECLAEMHKILEQSAAEMPDIQVVNQV